MREVKKVRILLADDHEVVRGGVRTLLKQQNGWKVVAEAANGKEAIEKAKKRKPQVAILDLAMPELDGLEATRQIRAASPNTEIVVLTMHDSDQMVRRVLEAGARGYVLKSDLARCLVEAVKTVSRGKLFLTPKVSDVVLEGFLKAGSESKRTGRSQSKPTPREVEIIELLAKGKANKEIASLLGITVRTVEAHRAKIMLKLGLHSLAELIHYAIGHGMVAAGR